MRNELLSNSDVSRIVERIGQDWKHGSMFFKGKRIRAAVAVLRNDLKLNDMDLFILSFQLLNQKETLYDLTLCRHIIGDTLGALLSVLQSVHGEIKNSVTLPFLVWHSLRNINKNLDLSKFSIDAQLLSILLEATALLLAAEESRVEAYVKSDGTVRSWKYAAKQAIDVANNSSKIAREGIDTRYMAIVSRIMERASAVILLDEEVEKRSPRYKYMNTDPGSCMPVVFVPYAFEPALADKEYVNEISYKHLVDNIGLREIYLTWLFPIAT